MSHVLFLGNLEGGSALLAGGQYCGEVRHAIRIYRDTQRDTIVAAGKLWGDQTVLEHAAAGDDLSLRLEDGRMVQVVVRGDATDKDYLCVGVEGGVPGF